MGCGRDNSCKRVKSLRGTKHEVIPDRIEVQLHDWEQLPRVISITNAIPEHVEPVIAKLRETGDNR